MPSGGEHESRDGADGGEQQRLDHGLAGEGSAAAAERGAHGLLALRLGRAHEQQARDVGAGDEQDEQPRPHQRDERRPHVLHQVGGHRFGAEMQSRSLLELEASTQLRRDRVHFGLRLSGRGSVAQAADQAENAVGSRGAVPVEAQCDVHVRLPRDAVRRREEQLEAGGGHSHDERARRPEAHRAVQDAAVAAEAALPELMAEHDDRRGWRRVEGCGGGVRTEDAVLLDEVAPCLDPLTEQREDIGGHVRDVDLLGLSVVANEHLSRGGDAGDSREVRRVRTKLLEVSGHHWNVASIPLEEVARDHEQLPRVRVWKRPEQHGICDTEDRGAGADSECERQDGGRREADMSAERARGGNEVPAQQHVSGSPRRARRIERCENGHRPDPLLSRSAADGASEPGDAFTGSNDRPPLPFAALALSIVRPHFPGGSMRVRNAVGLIALCVPGAVLAAQGSGNTSSDMSLGLRVGTLGIGVEASKLLSDHFGVRVGGNYFSLDQTQTKSDISFAAKLKLQAFTGLVDWFPGSRGTFHVTAGIITNPATIDGVNQPSGTGTTTINHVQYTQSQVGTLSTTIKYSSALPYAGLGWGTPASKDGGFGVLFDLGVAIGKPTVALASTGNAPGLAANVTAQQATMQTDANKVPVWPVISLGFVWRW